MGAYSAGSASTQILEGLGLARAESMEIRNDPRFFQDNVVNYRLAAFGSLSVVSGLMVGNAMHDIMEMDKNMNLSRWVGIVQFISFCLLCFILFFNVVGTYVGVAQPYHTIRLMTAGPTGFECAASYYLNKNIITWRHFAIKHMLLSLPLYVIQMGTRMLSKFDRGNKEALVLERDAPMYSDIEGVAFASILALCGLILLYIHYIHFAVFRERYETMTAGPGLHSFMQGMTNPRLTTQVNKDWRAGLSDVPARPRGASLGRRVFRFAVCLCVLSDAWRPWCTPGAGNPALSGSSCRF